MPETFSVTFHPQAAVVAGEVSAAALISVVGTEAKPAEVDASLFDGKILRLAFDDTPWPTPWQYRGVTYVGPSQGQVAEAMAFARTVAGPIAVHCLHGQSRSTAIALAIIADRCRNGDEAVRLLCETAARLPSATWPEWVCTTDVALAVVDRKPIPRARPRLQPNPGIVRYAESLLEMPGQLDGPLAAACPHYQSWRRFWGENGWR